MTLHWHDLVGTAGVILVLGTYLLLQTGRMSAAAVSYSVANAAGAALILMSLTRSFNFSAFLIEVVWLLISLYGVLRNGGLRRSSASSDDG